MPWVVDGNNLAGGGDRRLVRAAALDLARRQRIRIVVFFDGAPPPGTPEVERLGAVEVRYVRNADDAILGWLGRGESGWRVATDDRALASRAKAAGAEVVGSAAFLAKLEADGEGARDGRSDVDLDRELEYFRQGRGSGDEPRRVARKPRRR